MKINSRFKQTTLLLITYYYIKITVAFLAQSLLQFKNKYECSLMMLKKIKIKILVLILMLFLAKTINSQGVNIPQRTPEQEASKQTEKLQLELNLNSEQRKLVYDINLQYERQRQISNTRSEAMERIKNKNADIQRILTEQQKIQLQNKRFERSSVNVQNLNRNQNNIVNSSSTRSSLQAQPSNENRVITSETDIRKSNSRTSSSQNQPTLQQPKQLENNSIPPTEKRSPKTATNTPTRSNTNSQPIIRTQSNNQPSRSTTTPTNNPSTRSASQSNTNRR